jgi:predicted Zn-dependent protease
VPGRRRSPRACRNSPLEAGDIAQAERQGQTVKALSRWSLRGLAVSSALAAMICGAGVAAAAEASGIRDAEIENAIRTLASPVWRAAGLEPNDVGIYLISDSQLNSFVAGGQAIFINTGLILKAETPNQLVGVIAHETGHIVGGHILRTKEAMRNASIESLIAMAAALGASVVGKSGAPMLAAPGVAERSFARFSIGQEATADHAALNFLDRACQSGRGLLKFFEILQSNELLSGDRQDAWVHTHPFTAQRAQYVRDHVQQARCSNAPEPPGAVELFRLVKVKLRAFLDPPSTTLANFLDSDNSVPARYARAIAWYRIPNLDKALPAIDALIRDFPNNPYYRELKGQMLFENGRTREAMRPYEDAVRLAPRAPLLRISLSQTYIESGDAGLNKRAIAYLNDASREEGRDSQVWHFLAVAYGRDNQMGMAALSLAEQALANGKKKDAMQQADRAKQLLARNVAGFARAEEIYREAKQGED